MYIYMYLSRKAIRLEMLGEFSRFVKTGRLGCGKPRGGHVSSHPQVPSLCWIVLHKRTSLEAFRPASS